MSTENGTTIKKIKITLTGARPVNIDPELWPAIAEASDREFDGEYDFQANRMTKWRLVVRQHEKGCALVYGIYTYDSQYRGASSYELRGGVKLAPGADLVAAISAVAADMESAVEEVRAEDAAAFRRLGRECIGDLPAEELECCPGGSESEPTE